MTTQKYDGTKMSAVERLSAVLLRWSPMLAFLAIALPLPLYFLMRYFTATEEVGVYMLLVLTSLAVGSLAGLLAALLFYVYRRRWERRLRDRLSADGVTASELQWFASELTGEQRRTLREMEGRNPLLADAYRETLASFVTASRVLASARREASAVERRIANAAGLRAANRAELERDLQKDRSRLQKIVSDAEEHHAEIGGRLQMIEALASRDASQAETEMALLRLETAREFVPVGLASARAESEAREQTTEELRELPPTEKGSTP